MRNAAFPAIAAALIVSGCDGKQSQDQPVRPIKIHSEEQEQVHKASALNRAIGFKNAIYDSGYKCQRIVRTGYVGAYKNLDEWTASCADGRDWAVFIGPDGSAQVRDCKDVAAVGLPECTIVKEEMSAEPVTAATGNSTGGND